MKKISGSRPADWKNPDHWGLLYTRALMADKRERQILWMIHICTLGTYYIGILCQNVLYQGLILLL